MNLQPNGNPYSGLYAAIMLAGLLWAVGSATAFNQLVVWLDIETASIDTKLKLFVLFNAVCAAVVALAAFVAYRLFSRNQHKPRRSA